MRSCAIHILINGTENDVHRIVSFRECVHIGVREGRKRRIMLTGNTANWFIAPAVLGSRFYLAWTNLPSAARRESGILSSG